MTLSDFPIPINISGLFLLPEKRVKIFYRTWTGNLIDFLTGAIKVRIESKYYRNYRKLLEDKPKWNKIKKQKVVILFSIIVEVL